MRRLIGIAALSLLGACGGALTGSNRGPSFCAIGEAPWPSAASAFDRRLTLEVLNSLRRAVDADLAALRQGRRGEVGDQLTAISREPATTAFISSGTFELAVRLRQLGCAVRSNKVGGELAEQRYTHIRDELAIEQATLEPKGSALPRQASAP